MTPITLPLWCLPLILLPTLAALGAALLWLRRFASRRRRDAEEERDWSVPPLETGNVSSPFHRWDVRCKLAGLLVFAFLVVSLQHLLPALAALAISMLALPAARIPLDRALLRLLAVSGFLSLFLVVMPFSAPARPGDTVLVFGGLESLGFNLRGLELAATIAAKGLAVALLMEPMLATAPLATTLQGLSRLGAPRLVGEMALLCHRYLHVFRQEAARMATGMQVRGFRKRTDRVTLRAVSFFLGMLFVRSYDRTERVQAAMAARGYSGRLPEPGELRMRAGDLLLAGAWTGAGILLLLADRLFG